MVIVAAVRQTLTRAMSLVLPAVLVGLVAGSAYAQPNDAAEPPGVAGESDAAGVTLPWPTLGLSQGMDLYPDSGQRVTVQVPAGLTATRLQGLMHAPMNIGNGYLEISDGEGKFLAAVNLPPAGSAQAVTPFDVDISAAGRRPSSIDLSFTLRALDGVDRVCGPTQRLTLSDLATVFTGNQPPVNTIANFFPPVLERITIYAPTDANAAEQQAVLTLVSTLARIYSALKLDIAVVDHPRGAVPPPAPLGWPVRLSSRPAPKASPSKVRGHQAPTFGSRATVTHSRLRWHCSSMACSRSHRRPQPVSTKAGPNPPWTATR